MYVPMLSHTYVFFFIFQGVGRKVMERQGWNEGQGIGKHASGMTDALDNEGQTSRDKRGLG